MDDSERTMYKKAIERIRSNNNELSKALITLIDRAINAINDPKNADTKSLLEYYLKIHRDMKNFTSRIGKYCSLCEDGIVK